MAPLGTEHCRALTAMERGSALCASAHASCGQHGGRRACYYEVSPGSSAFGMGAHYGLCRPVLLRDHVHEVAASAGFQLQPQRVVGSQEARTRAACIDTQHHRCYSFHTNLPLQHCRQKYIEEQLAARLGKSAAQQQEDEQDPEVRRKKVG